MHSRAARRQCQAPQTLLGLSLCPAGQEGLGQSDSHGASGHQGLWKVTWEVCAPSVQGAGVGCVLGHFLPSPHPCAWGTEGLWGGSVALEEMSGQQGLVLCPRWRIRETTKEPTPMQTPEGFFTALQAGAWVQVHPTQRSRDLHPETKRRSSFIGASVPWER